VLKGQVHRDPAQEAGQRLLFEQVPAVLEVDVVTGNVPRQSQGVVLLEHQEAAADDTGEEGRGEAVGGDFRKVRVAVEILVEFLLDKVKGLFQFVGSFR